MKTSQPSVAESATIPDVVDVLAFARVVDLGSITAAATALRESKGTVSRRVSRLESLLGAALLRRHGRRVEPTDEGRRYREQAGRALDLLGDAAASLRSAQAEPSGVLRVTTPLGIAAPMLSRLLPAFLEKFPAVRVDVVATDAVLSFREHQVDVAFRFAQALPDSTLVAHRLFTLAPVLVASPGYLARRGRPAHPSELGDHDVLAVPVEPALRPRLTRGVEAHELRLRPRVASHDSALLRDLALAGAGITALLPHAAQGPLSTGELVAVLPDWQVDSRVSLYLLHAGGVLPPRVRAFRNHVRSAFIEGNPCPPVAAR